MAIQRVRMAAVVVSAAILGSGVLAAQAPTRQAPVSAGDLSSVLEATTRAVSPAVVEIFATAFAPGQGILPRTADLVTTQRASGSGVIVDTDGYIVTNAHVVRGAQRVRVELPISPAGQSILATRSRTVPARIVGVDLETDLAVLQIDERKLPALPFADSDAVNAGQLVLAFGSPLGLNNSVTLGVVSSIARQLEPESPMIYLQTDAPINPGSSGGPLVDTRGRLVGINTLIVSQGGGSDGLGFAAPSNIVRSVFEQIRKTGFVRRGDIGVRAQTVTPVLAAGLGLARDGGAIIADVQPGSPAAAVGIRSGDLVLTLDGKAIENGRQLQVGLYRRAVGETIALEVLRDGQPLKMLVTMGERRDALAGLTGAADPKQNLVPRLGILGIDLTEPIARMIPVVRARAGVVVASTVAGAIESRDGGLAPGDVIFAVNRTPVTAVAGLRAALDALKPGDPVVLQLERRGGLLYLSFTME